MTQIKATYIDHMGSDLSVVNAARVSFGKKSALEEPFENCDASLLRLNKGDTKLIKYLAGHDHISPFGHAFASFHCSAPIFVARQLVKHKFLRWNEISRRYVNSEPEFYNPDAWRGKSADKKQGSSDQTVEFLRMQGLSEQTVDDATFKHEQHSLTLYNDMINEGIAPEQARMVLPQSVMTEWYWSGSLDAFADMCELRCATDTQDESQVLAWQIYHKMEELFPVSWVALMEDQY